MKFPKVKKDERPEFESAENVKRKPHTQKQSRNTEEYQSENFKSSKERLSKKNKNHTDIIHSTIILD